MASSTSGRRTKTGFREQFIVAKTKRDNASNRQDEETHKKKSELNISIISDTTIDDIVDIAKAQQSWKKFSKNKGSAKHARNKTESSESQDTFESKKEKVREKNLENLKGNKTRAETKDIDSKKCNVNESAKKGGKSFVASGESLVLEMEKVSKGLKQITVNNDVDLSEDFSSLLMAPQFSSLIRTCILFYQIPHENMDCLQKSLCDLLISEIITANIVQPESLEEILVRIHRKDPSADLEAWKKNISAEICSISQASEAEKTFNLETAIQILILHCLPALLKVKI